MRNTTCSKTCMKSRVSECATARPRKGQTRIWVNCAECGMLFESKPAWVKRGTVRYCSKQCTGRANAPLTLVPHTHKSRAAVTPEGMASWRAAMTGPRNPAWKGGVTYTRKKGNYGRVKMVRCPSGFLPMARKNGYVAEHRLIVAIAMGRLLTSTEVVHHEDHDVRNNCPTNLALFATNRDHKLYEAHGSPLPLWCGWRPFNIAE